MGEIHCYRFEADIDASINDVFECLNKDEHVLKWNTQIIKNIYEGNEDDLKEGSTFITRQKIEKKVYELEGKYVKYEPPYRAILVTQTKEGISKAEYNLDETTEGTRFTVDVYLIPSNWIYKVAAKMFVKVIKPMYDEQFEAFVDYVHYRS